MRTNKIDAKSARVGTAFSARENNVTARMPTRIGNPMDNDD